MTVKQFVEAYRDFALENEKVTQVPYLVTLSQAALESGWGKHAPSFNFFGIKAGKAWSGKTQLLKTKEFTNGQMVSVMQPFRAYDNAKDSFKDHAMLLRRRFPKAFLRKEPVGFIEALQDKKVHGYVYATDPDYVSKITKIMEMIKKNEVV